MPPFRLLCWLFVASASSFFAVGASTPGQLRADVSELSNLPAAAPEHRTTAAASLSTGSNNATVRAWVILSDGEDYLHGALTLAYSIIATKSVYPVLVVTTRPIKPAWARRFRVIGAEIEQVAPMAIPPNIKARFPNWVGAMQKLQLLGMQRNAKLGVERWVRPHEKITGRAGPPRFDPTMNPFHFYVTLFFESLGMLIFYYSYLSVPNSIATPIKRFAKLAVIDADSLVRRSVDAAMDLPAITGPRNIWGCKDLQAFVSNFMVRALASTCGCWCITSTRPSSILL